MAKSSARDLTDAQNEMLRPLMRRLVAERGSQTEAAKALGKQQSTISAFLSGRQGISWAMAQQVCELLGEPRFPFTVATEMAQGFRRDKGVPYDLPVGSFLMKLRRMPGLEAWLESNPAEYTVLDVAQVMSMYDVTKPDSRSDGQPANGWGAFFKDVLENRLLAREPATGDQENAEQLERSQMSRGARKRLRSASKKA